jgi:hypothetical protein
MRYFEAGFQQLIYSQLFQTSSVQFVCSANFNNKKECYTVQKIEIGISFYNLNSTKLNELLIRL